MRPTGPNPSGMPAGQNTSSVGQNTSRPDKTPPRLNKPQLYMNKTQHSWSFVKPKMGLIRQSWGFADVSGVCSIELGLCPADLGFCRIGSVAGVSSDVAGLLSAGVSSDFFPNGLGFRHLGLRSLCLGFSPNQLDFCLLGNVRWDFVRWVLF